MRAMLLAGLFCASCSAEVEEAGAIKEGLGCEPQVLETDSGRLVIESDGSFCVATLHRSAGRIEVSWEGGTWKVYELRQVVGTIVTLDLFNEAPTGERQPMHWQAVAPVDYNELAAQLNEMIALPAAEVL